MILSLLDLFSCTSTRATCPGKASLPALRKRNTRKSEIRNYLHLSSLLPRAYLKNSPSILTTVVVLSLKKSLISAIYANSSRTFSTEWDTSTISSLTGWSRNSILKTQLLVLRLPMAKKPRKKTPTMLTAISISEITSL
jgi:hypothetical protein